MINPERVDFYTMPPRAEREVWCEWLLRHSIDPSDVVVPGWIERRPADYQVAYLALMRWPDGFFRLDPQTREWVFTIGIAQLEGPPLPFPASSGCMRCDAEESRCRTDRPCSSRSCSVVDHG